MMWECPICEEEFEYTLGRVTCGDKKCQKEYAKIYRVEHKKKVRGEKK